MYKYKATIEIFSDFQIRMHVECGRAGLARDVGVIYYLNFTKINPIGALLGHESATLVCVCLPVFGYSYLLCASLFSITTLVCIIIKACRIFKVSSQK